MKITFKTVTLDVKGETTEFVVWGSIQTPEDPATYALLIPRALYMELLKAIAVDEVHLLNAMSLYAIINGMYEFLSNSKKKEEVYFAVISGSNKRA